MKVITAKEAASLIRDGSTIGIGGFGGCAAPDDILRAMAESYAEKGSPRNLLVVAGISPGDLTEDGYGLSIIKADGIITGMYAAHVGMSPAIGRAVGSGRIAGWCVPLGAYVDVLKATAAGKPGILTSVGLYTFADPRVEGCCVNDAARAQGRDIVSLMNVDGKEYLFYKAFPMDICIIRGTYADEAGNISLEKEAFYSEQQAMAAAVHKNGGTVIVQVLDVVKKGSLHPRNIQVLGHIVDYVVVADPEYHKQCYDGTPYRPELVGDVRVELGSLPPMPLNPRKVCGRRGAMELIPNALINLGIGMPDSVASVANEEGISDRLTMSVETGVFGGVPVSGVPFGASVNPEAVYQIADNFDLYDGGVLDMAILGAAEIDEEGNVNVSKFGTRCTGPGGFINITQNTKRVCFMGTFTAGKLECAVGGGRLEIKSDGEFSKFKKKVQQITFSARYARENGQRVLYITERAVFELTEKGVTLIEIAPGVSLENDIIAKMEFRPIISPDLREMDGRIFREEKMGLTLA